MLFKFRCVLQVFQIGQFKVEKLLFKVIYVIAEENLGTLKINSLLLIVLHQYFKQEILQFDSDSFLVIIRVRSLFIEHNHKRSQILYHLSACFCWI